jgi:putative phosphoesterase
MKYCIFSDVHGNYINLVDMFKSTLRLDIDKYICLGDLCNYYSDNKAVIDFFIENKIECVLGNHDKQYISEYNLKSEQLLAYNFDFDLKYSSCHIEFLKSLPEKIILSENLKILLCHGSPNDFTNEYIYPNTDLNNFANCDFDIIFSGHTHRQFLRSFGSKIFCNVGSVGLPRDNGSLLGFVIFDSELNNITLYRKTVDKNALIQKYQNSVPNEVLSMLSREEPINFTYTLLE